jgi:Tol biopolymer transport system component
MPGKVLEQSASEAEVSLDPHEVMRQLKRVTESSEFVRSDQIVRFLRYTVIKTLEGDAGGLKERLIGMEVFRRGSDWDPKTDNIVRSEARRLRAKLQAYNERVGHAAPLEFTMPVGGYAITFKQNEPAYEAPLAPRQPAQEQLPGQVLGQTVARKRIHLLSAAAVLLVLLGGFAMWMVRARAASPVKLRFAPFSMETGYQFSPSFSPDGKRIAFVWDQGRGAYDIYTKEVGGAAPTRLTDNGDLNTHPAWSPDGHAIAYLRHRKDGSASLEVKTLSSGQERELHQLDGRLSFWTSANPLAGCQSLAWSHDGRSIYLTDLLPGGKSYGLVSVSLTDGTVQAITQPSSQDQDCFAHVSPRGDRLAYVRFISHGNGFLYTSDLNGAHPRRVEPNWSDIRGVDWTADGKALIVALNNQDGPQLETIRPDGSVLSVSSLPSSISSVATSPASGDLAFVESRARWEIWALPLGAGQAGKPYPLITSLGLNHSPSFSPDGTQVAFVSDRSGTPELWLCDRKGQHLRQLTNLGSAWLGSIRWAPDGHRIVFDARPNGHSAIYMLDIRGGKATLLEGGPFEARRPSWSRDGQFIYFDSTASGAPQAWRLNLLTHIKVAVGRAGLTAPVESNDGTMVFFTDASSGHLLVSDRWGNHLRAVGDSLRPELDWCPRGGGVLMGNATGEGTSFFDVGLSPGSITPVATVPQSLTPGTPSMTYSPVDRMLLYSAVADGSSLIDIGHYAR